MTVRLSLLAFVLAAGLATTASATSYAPPHWNFMREALQHLFLLDFAGAERNRETARKWLDELPPEDREELLDTMARRFGELAGYLNDLVAKAAAPETREEVFVPVLEMTCMWGGVTVSSERLDRWDSLPVHPGEYGDPVHPSEYDGGFGCPPVLRYGDRNSRRFEGVEGLLEEPENAILLKLIVTERNRKNVRKWLSELAPEKRSDLMAEGSRWLVEAAGSLNELAAEAAAPETREDVFVRIAQKSCEEEYRSFGPRYLAAWCRQY